MRGRPYVWRGGDDDSRETQIRHRVAIARQRAAELVAGPDPEWYREMLAEQADDIAAVLSPGPPPGRYKLLSSAPLPWLRLPHQRRRAPARMRGK